MDGLIIKVKTSDGNEGTYSLRPKTLVAFENKYNKGMVRKSGEGQENPSAAEIIDVADRYRSRAETRSRRAARMIESCGAGIAPSATSCARHRLRSARSIFELLIRFQVVFSRVPRTCQGQSWRCLEEQNLISPASEKGEPALWESSGTCSTVGWVWSET